MINTLIKIIISLPDYVVGRLNNFIMDIHGPEWYPQNGTGPVVCKIDHKLWPCKEYLNAMERTQ